MLEVQPYALGTVIPQVQATDEEMGSPLAVATRVLLQIDHEESSTIPRFFLQVVGPNGEHIERLTRQIAIGTRTAGLLSSLNLPNFSVADLESNARLKTDAESGAGQQGAYLRVYRTVQGLSWIQWYAGKTTDYLRRFHDVLLNGSHSLAGSSEMRHHLCTSTQISVWFGWRYASSQE